MKVTINSEECTSYPQTYKFLITDLCNKLNIESKLGETLSDFLVKYKEEIGNLEVEIIGSKKFKDNLSYEDTIAFCKGILKVCSFDDLSLNISRLKMAEKHTGPTMYDRLITVLKENGAVIILN